MALRVPGGTWAWSTPPAADPGALTEQAAPASQAQLLPAEAARAAAASAPPRRPPRGGLSSRAQAVASWPRGFAGMTGGHLLPMPTEHGGSCRVDFHQSTPNLKSQMLAEPCTAAVPHLAQWQICSNVSLQDAWCQLGPPLPVVTVLLTDATLQTTFQTAHLMLLMTRRMPKLPCS